MCLQLYVIRGGVPHGRREISRCDGLLLSRCAADSLLILTHFSRPRWRPLFRRFAATASSYTAKRLAIKSRHRGNSGASCSSPRLVQHCPHSPSRANLPFTVTMITTVAHATRQISSSLFLLMCACPAAPRCSPPHATHTHEQAHVPAVTEVGNSYQVGQPGSAHLVANIFIKQIIAACLSACLQ